MTAPTTADYVRRGGLLVPADLPADAPPVPVPAVAPEPAVADVVELVEPAGEPAPAQLVPAAQPADPEPEFDPTQALADRLAYGRARTEVERHDVLARREQDVEHRIALAGVSERAAAAKLAAKRRARDERDADDLAALYTRAAQQGHRARIRADIKRSAEMRALRIDTLQRVVLVVGLVVLAAFAAWSTPGVQDGLVSVLRLDHGSILWWAAWVVEPAIITIVAGIILMRAVLRTSGGDTDRRATIAEWTGLTVSVALNMTGGWAGHAGWVTALGEALGHSIGALGAAGTAWLIGVAIDYTTRATPWVGAPRLADLDILTTPPATAPIEISSDVRKISTPHDDSEARKIESASGSSDPVRPDAANAAAAAAEEARRASARDAWTAAALAGKPLSGAELGRKFELSERWGQERAKEARAALNGHAPAEPKLW